MQLLQVMTNTFQIYIIENFKNECCSIFLEKNLKRRYSILIQTARRAKAW